MAAESRVIVVVVEEEEVSMTALKWALRNIIRGGDLITLFYSFHRLNIPSVINEKQLQTRRRMKRRSKSAAAMATRQSHRLRRLKGFQLALSFNDLCVLGVPQARVEIVVTEGEQSEALASLVTSVGASLVVLGLHERSFIYKMEMVEDYLNRLHCRILAVKQAEMDFEFANTEKDDFSQIEIVANLSVSGGRGGKTRLSPPSLPSLLGAFWKCQPHKKKKT